MGVVNYSKQLKEANQDNWQQIERQRSRHIPCRNESEYSWEWQENSRMNDRRTMGWWWLWKWACCSKRGFGWKSFFQVRKHKILSDPKNTVQCQRNGYHSNGYHSKQGEKGSPTYFHDRICIYDSEMALNTKESQTWLLNCRDVGRCTNENRRNSIDLKIDGTLRRKKIGVETTLNKK